MTSGTILLLMTALFLIFGYMGVPVAFALMAGVPAKQIGWMSRFGERVELPLKGDGQWICSSTGDRYELRGDLLTMTRGKTTA